MELAEGWPLTDVIGLREARGFGPLPVLDALTTAEQVCAGLAAAHAAGIVHRDITPPGRARRNGIGVAPMSLGQHRCGTDVVGERMRRWLLRGLRGAAACRGPGEGPGPIFGHFGL
jgi:hypothetical protein